MVVVGYAFKTSLTCITRIELDGKRNSEIARKDPWEMIAQKWNDPDFFVHLVVIHICTMITRLVFHAISLM